MRHSRCLAQGPTSLALDWRCSTREERYIFTHVVALAAVESGRRQSAAARQRASSARRPRGAGRTDIISQFIETNALEARPLPIRLPPAVDRLGRPASSNAQWIAAALRTAAK